MTNPAGVFTRILFILIVFLSSARPTAPVRSATPDPAEPGYDIFLPITVKPAAASPFGVEILNLKNDTVAEHLKASGARWVRKNGILWSEVEPERGQRDWTALAQVEQDMLRTNTAGAQMVMVVRSSTPTWAQKYAGSVCGPIAAEYLPDFANFVGELVQRYSQPPYNVRYWEIGNEPEVYWHTLDMPYGCWGDPAEPYNGGEYYSQMLRQVYSAAKAANPDVKVVLGGILFDCAPHYEDVQNCNAITHTFLEGVLRNGGSGYFDAVSYHSYDTYGGELGSFSNRDWGVAWNTTGPLPQKKTQVLRDLLEQHGAADKELLLTEVGLTCYRQYIACDADFEETKAQYLIKVYTLAAADGIDAVFWYDLYGWGWLDTGLLYRPDQPRPAYYAYQFISQQLWGAEYIGQRQDHPGLVVYEFRNSGQRLWIAWSVDGEQHPLHLTYAPAAAWNSVGEEQVFALEFPLVEMVGAAPLVLQWAE